MLKDIALYIADETSKTIGTNLFIGFFPSDAHQTNAMSFLKNSGGETIEIDGRPVGDTGGDRQDFALKVISRGKDYLSASDEAYLIYNKLVLQQGMVFPPATEDKIINVVEGVLPQDIGQDKKGRWEFSANYLLKISDCSK